MKSSHLCFLIVLVLILAACLPPQGRAPVETTQTTRPAPTLTPAITLPPTEMFTPVPTSTPDGLPVIQRTQNPDGSENTPVDGFVTTSGTSTPELGEGQSDRSVESAAVQVAKAAFGLIGINDITGFGVVEDDETVRYFDKTTNTVVYKGNKDGGKFDFRFAVESVRSNLSLVPTDVRPDSKMAQPYAYPMNKRYAHDLYLRAVRQHIADTGIDIRTKTGTMYNRVVPK